MRSAQVKATRSCHFDNAKAVLVFLVVLAHVFTVILAQHKDNELIAGSYRFINLIAIPSFVFITGYFAKKDATLIDTISKFIIPLIVFQIIYHLFNFLLGFDKTLLRPFRELIHTPYRILWYLLSSFFWAMMLKLVNDKYLIYLIAVSFVIAIFIGCIPFIDLRFSLSRTIYYFPFFLLGYYFRNKEASLSIKPTILTRLVMIVTFSVAFFWCFKFYQGLDWRMLHGHSPFRDFKLTIDEGIVIRIQVFLLSIATSICFFNLIPSNRTFFTKYGAMTLQIYLFHDFIIHIVKYLNIFNNVPFSLPAFILSFFIAIITFLITTLPVFHSLLVKLTSLSQKNLSKIGTSQFIKLKLSKYLQLFDKSKNLSKS